MNFWMNVWSNVLGGVIAGLIFSCLYFLRMWFLRLTDITVGYAWSFQKENGITVYFPSFDIRNRSRAITYRLGNIAYIRKGDKYPFYFDNDAIFGHEMKPGSINYMNGKPVHSIESLTDCSNICITLRLQNGYEFWLRGSGPGQLSMPKLQKLAFYVRDKIERSTIPTE